MVLKKSFLIRNDGGMLNRRQNPYLVECILLLFLRQIAHLDFLESIVLAITKPLNLIDFAVGAISDLSQNHKVPERHVSYKIL